jgi:hypothetical protein
MKITKSKILLIKLAVLCAMTFGLFYANPTQASLSFCTQCYNNCAAGYRDCMNTWYGDNALCSREQRNCEGQCRDIVCKAPMQPFEVY